MRPQFSQGSSPDFLLDQKKRHADMTCLLEVPNQLRQVRIASRKILLWPKRCARCSDCRPCSGNWPPGNWLSQRPLRRQSLLLDKRPSLWHEWISPARRAGRQLWREWSQSWIVRWGNECPKV